MEEVIILSLKWIIVRWIFVAIVVVCLACIYWAIAKCFAKKRFKCLLIWTLMIALSIFIYIFAHKKPTVVYMREDTLYIRPAPIPEK